jgi:amino acid transporter
VLCFAEAGSLFDQPGGGYVYTRAAFGDFIGFEVGWMTWLARVSAAAGLSAGFAQALTTFWPAATGGPGRLIAIAIPIAALTVINVIGVKHGVRTAVVLTLCKLLPLLFLIAMSVTAVEWERILPIAATEPQALGAAAFLLLFAYAGFENTAAPAGEFTNPRRDIPFALLVMIASVTGLYSLVQLVALGTVPHLAEAQAPLADAGRAVAGSFGAALLGIGALLSILGTNNNTVLAGSRYLYALAHSGHFPAVFARVHPRFRTPWIALTAQTCVALPLALSGTFTELAALSVVARMATYIGTAAAIPVLRRRLTATPRTFRLPGGPAIPFATVVMCLALLSAATPQNLIAGTIALVVGAGVYTISAKIGVE